MKKIQNNQSQRLLYIVIVSIALIAIVSILIINNAKPKDDSGDSGIKYTDSSETDSRQDSSDNKKQDSSTNTKSDAESNSSSDPAPSSSTSPNSTAPSYTPIPQPVEHKCYHEEAGVCWDDLENDAYSAGLYDHEYGYYGASYNEPDNCDAICRDILEDAYEEGWADGM